MHEYASACVHASVCMSICMWVCMCAYMYVHACVRVWIMKSQSSLFFKSWLEITETASRSRFFLVGSSH